MRTPTAAASVITGAGDRAFAAGADIKELIDQTPESLAAGGSFDAWDRIRRVRKPIIAAVRGYALGGGCELAMACDMIVAGDDAQFGQPEIKIGVIPGAGGTQRLTRAIGKAKAMELILTGRSIDAAGGRRARPGDERRPGRGDGRCRPGPRESDRGDAAARGRGRQGGRQGRVRRQPHDRTGVRAAPLLRPVRERGSARGHGRVRRKAYAALERPLG